MYDPFLTFIFIIIMIFIFVITIIILILFLGKQKQRKDMVAKTTSQEGVKPGEETRIIVPLPVPSLPPTTMGCSCIKVSYFLMVIYSFSVHLVGLFNMPDVFWRLSFATSAIMTVLESEVTDEIFVLQLRTSLAQAIILLTSCGLSSRRKNERKESFFYPKDLS